MKPSIIALVLATTAAVVAQTAPSLAVDSPAVSPSPAPAREVSPTTANLLKASLPKLEPVKAEDQKSAAEKPDLRDTDKPAATIVRLPKFMVAEKPPIFTERELYGERAFGEQLARHYYPEWYLAFNRVALWTPLRLYLDSAANSALAQFYEEERLRKMDDIADLTNMVMRSDPVAGAKVKSIAQDTFMRQSDIGWDGGPR